MKALILSHTSDLIGGAERSMLNVFDILAKDYGVEPEFIIREPLGTLVGELKKRGWKYYPIKYTFWSWPTAPSKEEDIFRESVQNSAAVVEIEKIISKTRPDIVFTNTVICPWAALAAHFMRVPHVWFPREYGDLDHGRQFEIDHAQVFEDVGNLSNLVVSNSETLAQYIEQYVDKSKVTTLYVPFDLESVRRRAAIKISSPYRYDDSLKLVMTSNIARTKGHLEAVVAAGILNQQGHKAELVLVGKNVDKPYAHEIEQVIKKYGIADKVHLVGLQANALAFVAAADIGIVASRREAFGRTTFEYMAIGKPVAGADAGATPEMVKSDSNGYLFEPGDSQGLAKVLLNYVNNPSLLQKHGEASSKKAELMMSGKYNIESLYKKIKPIAEGKGSAKPPPINYLHRWFDFQQNAQDFINGAGQASIRRTVRLRLRQKAKTNYYRARKIKARITGK